MTSDSVADLDAALDHLLAVRVAIGGVVAVPMPERALDVALGLHEDYQQTRRAFVAALAGARDAGATDEAIFAVEASANALIAFGAEVGWMLGVTARAAVREPNRPVHGLGGGRDPSGCSTGG